MVTKKVQIPASFRRRLAVRLALASVVLVAVFAALLSYFWVAAHRALPQVDGRLSVPGLSAPVSVTRDAQGLPNVNAANLDDLFLAQGFVTAQDRLWQMDMTRRFAAGELSEVLGGEYLAHDRQQRTLQIRQAAENAAARLPARERAQFEAYARGVNAFIAIGKLPIEFRVLRYRPHPWTVTDSFLVACSMVQMLSLESVAHELDRQQLSTRLAPELAAELFPNSSWRDHPPVPGPEVEEYLSPELREEQQEQPATPQPAPPPRRRGHARSSRQMQGRRSPGIPHHIPRRGASRGRRLASAGRPGEWQRLESLEAELRPGSNNWVVSGAHTISGKPLLANDMHLPHQIPNVWYEAHLTSGAYDVAGVTLPGVPYVIVGHNRRIAWGFTNLAPAVADLFIETFNERGEYQTPQGWRLPEHRREVIRVRRGKLLNLFREVPVDVLITRHGPLVSNLDLAARAMGGKALPGDKGQPLALKWTIYDPQTLQVPLFDLNMAQNWEEFRRALERFGNPAQNVVYADVDGHIGYQATGMIPVRASGDGALPAPGNDDSHEWTGYIPFEQLPSVLDPPSGVIATANGRITPDGSAQVISNEWGSPYRTERIYRVLGADRKFAAADMLALQNDVYSDFDRFCAQRLVYAVDHAANASPRARQAAELMRNWDGRESAGAAAATITARSRQELTRLLLTPKLGDARADYHWFMAPVWLENLLLMQPEHWLPPDYGNWDDLLAAAVDAAVSAPDAPRSLADWHWGSQLTVEVSHPIFGRIPGLGRWASTGEYEQSGNGYTVKQVGKHFGPSERMTVDFANLDGSTLNIVNGESGQLFSPHFNDQWQAWHQGTTFPLPYTAQAVGQARRHELVLEPR